MKKLMLLAAMLAMVVMLVVAAPAIAQDAKAAKAQAKADNKKAEMPKTGGAPINAALLGLGGGALLVGGGLLVQRVTRR